MKKAYILLVLGIWVTILSFLGFPSFVKDALFTITGIGIIFLSYMFYKDNKAKQDKKEIFDNFSENKFEDSQEH